MTSIMIALCYYVHSDIANSNYGSKVEKISKNLNHCLRNSTFS